MLFQDMTLAAVKKSIVDAELKGSELTLERMAGVKELYDNVLKPLRTPSMSDRTYERREEAWTPVAFTAMIVDKIASLIYSRSINRTLVDEAMTKIITESYKQQDAIFIQVTKLASMGGFAALRIRRHWDKTITFSCYDFSEVRPILDPDNRHGKPIGIVFDVTTDHLPDWARAQISNKDDSVYQFQEMITRHVRDEDGRIAEAGKYLAWVDGKPINTPTDGLNPLGDYLGAVYWRGGDHPFNPYGKSDVLPLYETLVSLNELMTDGRENITWNIHSPIITTAAGDIKWKMGADSIIQLKQNTEAEVWVKRLEKGTDTITDFIQFLEVVINIFHQTSRIPSIAVGDLTGIGQVASSGVALQIAMTPAIELVAEKEKTIIPQELYLMEEIFAKKIYYGDMPGKTYPFEGLKMPDPLAINAIMEGATVEFAPIEMPRQTVPESISGLVTAKLQSRKKSIKELHPAWTDEMIDEEIKEIESETSAGPDALAEQNRAELLAQMNNGQEVDNVQFADEGQNAPAKL